PRIRGLRTTLAYGGPPRERAQEVHGTGDVDHESGFAGGGGDGRRCVAPVVTHPAVEFTVELLVSRHEQHHVAVGCQRPGQLSQCADVIGDVLQHVDRHQRLHRLGERGGAVDVVLLHLHLGPVGESLLELLYGPGVDVGHHVAVDTGESGGELTEPRTDLQYRASTVRADEFTLIGQITRLTVIAFEVASRGGVEGVGNATGAVLGALCRHVCLRASVRDRCYRSVVRS